MFTTRIIHIIESGQEKDFGHLLNSHERFFYEQLTQQLEFFLANVPYPESYKWLNTYEFLAYALTAKAQQITAERISCNLPGANESEYSEEKNNLLNAVYNNFKNFIINDKEISTILKSGYLSIKDKLDENGEPRIVS